MGERQFDGVRDRVGRLSDVVDDKDELLELALALELTHRPGVLRRCLLAQDRGGYCGEIDDDSDGVTVGSCQRCCPSMVV